MAGFVKIGKEYIGKFLPPQEEASYIVFRDGNIFYAKDGRTGQIIYTSSDSEALLQYVLDSAQDGDVIYVKDVVYADTLVAKKRVVLTGSGAIYTKTGKLVRLLGNIVVKDLEVDFYTPRTIKQAFIEQFTDTNLTQWQKYIPSGGSAQVYEETKTVAGLTYVERGVVVAGSSTDATLLFKELPLAYKKMRIVVQVVDLATPSADKSFFTLAIPGAQRPSGTLSLFIDTSGNMKIVYVNIGGTTATVSTGVSIAGRPAIIVIDADNKNNYARVYIDGKVFTINDWKSYTDLKYICLIGSAGYTAKFNIVYAEYLDETAQTPVSTVGRPDTYHPVGISDALGVYALGLVYPDGSTHVEIRDLETDALIKVIDLDETASYTDEHEYVHTKFAVEGSKRYLYVVLARHNASYTIYKIDADNWSVVWKKAGSAGSYCKLIWGWVTGLAVLYRDNDGNTVVDHIDPATGSVSSRQTIVSSGGYYIYATLSPDWSDDGYLWLAWSFYDFAVGLRKDVYALAIDRSGNAYAPDGTRVTLPASPTDSKLLIETSNYSQPIVRPAREGAVVVRTGMYTPDTPSAWWLKKPGQVLKLELPQGLPIMGLSLTVTIGRIPACYEATYVLRTIGATTYHGIPTLVQLPTPPLPQGSYYFIKALFMPAKKSRILALSENYLYIYKTGYEARYDKEINIS